MDNLAELFHYPSVFKGFLDKIETASNVEELKKLYTKLIQKSPKADIEANIRTSTELKNSIPYKLRDDSYVIIMEYSQYKENNKELFIGRAAYLFTKKDNIWKISGVF
tara:strand:- start:96 stop:419 length:324 start_codon:yes stop_codon:yes gene_type:complete